MSDHVATARDEGARLLQAGSLDAALQNLEQAVRQDPADAKAFALLGICRTRKGDSAGGIEALTQATRISPGDAVLRYNLGVALSQSGRPEEAKPELAQALAINPNHAGARELLHRLESTPASAFTPPPAAASYPAAPTPGATTPPPVPVPGAYPEPPAQQPAAWSAPPIASAPPIGSAPPHQPTPQPAWATAPDASPGAPPAWTPAPPPSAEGPPAWTPAPPTGAAQQDAFTGSPAAMYYAQDQTYGGKPPSLGLRLLRGWGWGTLYGQWWTLWTIISMFIWGGASLGLGMVVVAVGYAFVYSFFGALVGLTIGAANLDEDQGVWVGVGAGLLVLALEFLVLSQSPLSLINVFFYFFTGRYIGRGVAGRVQHPAG